MPSLSQSAEHEKIHETRELLRGDARNDLNGGLENTSWRVANLIGASTDRNQVVSTAGLWTRIIGNTPTRGERRKVRQMAGMSKSDIKNHKRRTVAKAQEAMKMGHVANKYGITPDDLRLHAAGWDSHDEENFQDELARANGEVQY